MSGRLRQVARDVTLKVAANGVVRPPATSHAPRRILILQPDHLGDVLLSQPAVTLLREAHPEYELIGVVGPWSAEIARRAWSIDRIVEVAFPGFTRQVTSRRARLSGEAYRQVHRDAGILRAERAETAIVLRPDGWWAAWLGALSAAQVVAGDDPQTARFATTTVPLTSTSHAAERAAAIAGGALTQPGASRSSVSWRTHPLHLPVDGDAHEQVAALLRDLPLPGPFAVLHPGAGAAVKQWLPQRWPGVVRHLRERGLRVVLTGSAGEQLLCREIVAMEPDVLDLSGRTNLAELIELLRRATVVVGPDSGPLHLAVATQTPSVHLFGPADPRRYGPWGDPALHRVVHAGMTCPRCGDLSPTRAPGCGCMLAIGTSAVCDAIDAALDAAPAREFSHG